MKTETWKLFKYSSGLKYFRETRDGASHSRGAGFPETLRHKPLISFFLCVCVCNSGDSQKVPEIVEGDRACPLHCFLNSCASVMYNSVKAVQSTGCGAVRMCVAGLACGG